MTEGQIEGEKARHAAEFTEAMEPYDVADIIAALNDHPGNQIPGDEDNEPRRDVDWSGTSRERLAQYYGIAKTEGQGSFDMPDIAELVSILGGE